MTTLRNHHHPSLPAPVVHSSFSVQQSKSHVLAGVQDAYWSDDDADDAECPLCLEEMDISDINFKPCPCGYQICRFCWHHIKENLNGRCPACRRQYTDDAVEFKAIAKDDHKRLTQQKKQRERERKELDALGRRQLANVRVVQRNVVYVVGIGPRFAKEDLISTLRSNDYFGQYGKISKMILVKRTPSGGGAPVVGLYITYHRREDATRCIAAVDGSPSPGGGREIMRASHGTTKYCMAFLRGLPCSDQNCMNLHEWGDEKDCFTKEDLTTLKHAMKDTETRARATPTPVPPPKREEADGLPRNAAWGSKAPTVLASHGLPSSNAAVTTQRAGRRTTTTRQTRSTNNVFHTETKPARAVHERKTGATSISATKSPSLASSSRPSTPANAMSQRPATPPDVKALRQKAHSPAPSPSPAPSTVVESELGSGSQDVPPSPAPRPASAGSAQSPAPVAPAVPPGLPSAPPGLLGPPGLQHPSKSKTDNAQPSSYQISTAAQALLDDVKARRVNNSNPASNGISPFPDLDRTLNSISGLTNDFGGFSFNLDPQLAGNDTDAAIPELEMEATTPFSGTFMDAFPAVRPASRQQSQSFMTPPGLPYSHNPNRSIYDPLAMRPSPIERQSTNSPNYSGSFNPFSELSDGSSRSDFPDGERKVSRFGFARGRQGSAAHSVLPPEVSALRSNDMRQSSMSLNDTVVSSQQQQWSMHRDEMPYNHPHSPMLQQHAPHAPVQQQMGRFQPFDTSMGVSEAQLREFIQSSRRRDATAHPGVSAQHQYQYSSNQAFSDPAIMSARFASPTLSSAVASNGNYPNSVHTPGSISSHGPPPGLSFPPGIPLNSGADIHAQGKTLDSSLNMDTFHLTAPPNVPDSSSPSPSPTPALSNTDFPALGADTVTASARPDSEPASGTQTPNENTKEVTKAVRKAEKKAAAAQRALERQKAAQEKAAAKAAEKAKLAQEKTVEKEREAELKAAREKERTEKEEAEKSRLAQEKAERERIAAERTEKVEKERLAKEEKRLAAQAEKEKAEKANAQKAAKQAVSQNGAKTTTGAGKEQQPTAAPEVPVQAPIMSRMPKKNKPVSRPIRIPKEELPDEASTIPSAALSDTGRATNLHGTSSNNSRAQSVDRLSPSEPISLAELLDEIELKNPTMDLPNHPFFDLQKINPAAKMPLEYGPLVHALSALSVGGGSFATNMPSGSIDNAVSSFQQLLETLTQTISDLLRLLPRTTWDDSSSFDGVLRDMLKGDDFLDDAGEDSNGKDDEVAALTLALERRARWMEVQLSKLEELHRDINNAAVRAVLALNDSGWDRHAFMPRSRNTLRRFDIIGMIEQDGELRPMNADELEKKLIVAREAAVFAETEFREAMERMQDVRPMELEEY